MIETSTQLSEKFFSVCAIIRLNTCMVSLPHPMHNLYGLTIDGCMEIIAFLPGAMFHTYWIAAMSILDFDSMKNSFCEDLANIFHDELLIIKSMLKFWQIHIKAPLSHEVFPARAIPTK